MASDSVATNGICPSDCNTLLWYIVIFSLTVLAHSTSEVGSMMLTLRLRLFTLFHNCKLTLHKQMRRTSRQGNGTWPCFLRHRTFRWVNKSHTIRKHNSLKQLSNNPCLFVFVVVVAAAADADADVVV